MSIGDGEERNLLAFHEFLDQYFAAGISEYAIAQHGVDRALRLGCTLRDHDPFSRRETRCLHHHR